MTLLKECDCWKNQVIVSHIPHGVTRTDLYRLFKSAAQVQGLKYIPVQGKAVVSLYDPLSLDFILDQDWQLSGSSIRVCRSRQCHNYCHLEKDIVKSNRTSKVFSDERNGFTCTKVDYKHFKVQRDPFWSDVPHEKCQVAKKKKKRKWIAVYLQNLSKSQKSLTQRKRYTKLTGSVTMNGHHFQRRKPPHKVKKPTSDTWEEGLTESQKQQEPFHLYLKYKGIFRLEFETIPSLQELKHQISLKSKVPQELQMITYHGKLLKPPGVKSLWSSDTIHLIVRGKGGMQAASEELSGAQKCGVLKGSSARDVKLWLVNEVKVPTQYIENNEEIKFLDGDALFSYQHPQELKEDSGIPVGISRKILYLRDNPFEVHLNGIPIYSLESITSERIQQMVIEKFKNDENYSEIAGTLKNEEVDAFVVMLYKDHQLFANDYHLSKVASRRLLHELTGRINQALSPLSGDTGEGQRLQKSNFGKEMTEVCRQKSNTDEVLTCTERSVAQSGVKPDLLKGELGTQEESGNSLSLPRTVRLSPDEAFLEKLGFEKLYSKEETQCEQCDLVAIHNYWGQGNPNVLSKSFLFFVLCKTKSDLQNTQAKTKLWETICMNTNLWIDTLPPGERKLFKAGKSPGTFQYKCSKTVKLGKTGAVVKNFLDVSQEMRQMFDSHLLIIHESVTNKCNQYLYFKLKKGCFRYDMLERSCWLYSEDGQLTKSGNTHCETELFSEAISELKAEDGNDFQVERGAGDVGEKHHVFEETDTEQADADDNSVLSDGSDIFGQQIPRQFKHDGSNTVYIKGYVINRPESGSEMIIPSLEFKYFRLAVETGDPVKKFLAEVLRFACGCLNRRRNGTIYFGVADEKLVEGQNHKHGEIVGFPIVDIDSDISKSRFTDKLDQAKRTFLITNKASKAVEECISSPRFVLVQPSPQELPLYVMEVDIEPSIVFCEGVTFKADITKLEGKKSKPILYVRDGASTIGIANRVEEENFNLNLEKFDQKRKQEEQVMMHTKPKRSSRKYLTDKLCAKLCKGTHVFNQSQWPILVSTKPTFIEKDTLFQTLTFIPNIQWSAVLDFDDESFINGLCRSYFVGPATNHVNSTKFRHIANTEILRSELGLPEKTVYIFCNGRMDMNIPHLTEREWENEYSPGVKGAINFLQQESIIPVGRAIVIFLLLSTDTEGFLDTFKEIKTYFKIENIVMLCDDETIFKVFKQKAVQRNIASARELDECSVVGMTWEQASNVFNKLLGSEEKHVTMIPSSTRSDVEVNPQFLEGLDCLAILGSNECETKEFDSDTEKKQFAHSKDIKFYKGNRVEWWNFYFKGQVVERSCFESLREKVEDALQGVNSDNRAVLRVYLTHEPGAGGSTLARNILWHFRKRYRCAVLSKLVEKTAADITNLWKYKEREEDAVPLLVLIDSLAVQEIELFQLHRLIVKAMLRKTSQNIPLVCVFFVCHRDGELKDFSPCNHFDAEYNERLFQRLDKREQSLFKEKIEELEKTSCDLGLIEFKGEHFISFMILHSDFNPEYIRKTVQTLIETLDVNSSAIKLVMCVALFVAYVSPPKGAAPIAIPLECCDELMGHTAFVKRKLTSFMWEDHLERAVKILLLIEPKENGSGKEIRMAHPTLAKEVIDYIKNKFKREDFFSGESISSSPLSQVVMTVLESRLLESASYSKRYVYELIIQMLTIRKKEEYGDTDTSKFSPLIESICKEDPSTCKPAAAVMEKAFHIIQEGFFAQQMARLYLYHQMFLEAKAWAEKAVEMNPNKSPYLHTLGLVFKDTFKSSKVYNGKLYLTPDNQKLKVEMDHIFKALHLFEKASSCENEFSLFACLDTLETVNIIVDFLSQNILRSDSDKEKFHRYLTEENYLFDDIDTPLIMHRSGFKSLYNIGSKAIHVLDENIYYKLKTYASQFNRSFNREHRTSRAIKKRLPKLIKTFTAFFGENKDIDNPPEYIRSPEMQDEWHRRCVLSLIGNRLIGACDLIFQCKSKGKPVECARETLEKTYEHLMGIQDKEPEDLLNLISINFAAVHLKSSKICIPMKELLAFCKFIIDKSTDNRQQTSAYMYALMMLWPRTGTSKESYESRFLEQAVKYLQSTFSVGKQPRSRYEVEYGEIFKRENNLVRTVPLFYEGKGRGMSCLYYQKEILGSLQFQEVNDDLWERQTQLRLMKGVTKKGPNGAVSVLVDSSEFEIDHKIEVKYFKCRKPLQGEQNIKFYLGFTISGPAVCYIIQEKPVFSRSASWIESSEYDNKSETELRKSLQHLRELKKKGDLTHGERKLIEDEELIKDALLQYEENMD